MLRISKEERKERRLNQLRRVHYVCGKCGSSFQASTRGLQTLCWPCVERMIDDSRANGRQLLLFSLDDLYHWPKMIEMPPGEKKPVQKAESKQVQSVPAGEAIVTPPLESVPVALIV